MPSKEKEVLEQVTWRLDKLENDTLPQVDLSSLEVRDSQPSGACTLLYMCITKCTMLQKYMYTCTPVIDL